MKTRSLVILLFTALGMLLMPVATASAAQLHAPHVGTSVTCDGPVLWHFVHNQVNTSTTTPGTITATFNTGTETEAASKRLRNVRHYDVVTPSGATLVSASDDIAEGKLVLSHTECLGGDEEDVCIPGTTTTVRWPGVELGQPTVSGLVESASTSVSLLPGEYQVTLTSTDVMHEAGFQTNQTKEQWFVRLLSGGTEVAATGVIADLPDASTTLTQSVGTVTLTTAVDTAVATHLLAGQDPATWGAPHSVEPTTAAFLCV